MHRTRSSDALPTSFCVSWLFACSIGLAGLLFTFGKKSAMHWVHHMTPSPAWVTWAKSCMADSKPGDVGGYLLATVGTGLFILVMRLFYRKPIVQGNDTLSRALPVAIALNAVLAGAFLSTGRITTLAWLSLVWLSILLVPLYRLPLTSPRFTWLQRQHQKIPAICLALSIASVAPWLGFTSLNISNDFLWSPETTLLGQQPVDNNTFIMQHGIGGLHDSRFTATDPVPTPSAYTLEEQEFIKKNTAELTQLFIPGHYFYHHYAMLGPVSEILLGASPKEIHFLYGFGTAHLLSAWFKNFTGGLSFEKYIAVTYAFYPLYLLLFFLTCRTLFGRETLFTALAMTACTACFLLNDFEAIRFAPGFNPIRHWPDLLLILSFHHAIQQKKTGRWLCICWAIALVAIINNLQFGLMMSAALAAASILHGLAFPQKMKSFLITGGGIIAALGTAHWLHSLTGGDASLMLYMLMGVSVPPTHPMHLLALLAVSVMASLVLFHTSEQKGYRYPRLYLALFLLFYSECVSVYFVWFSEPSHLLATSAIWVLCVLVILREALPDIQHKLYVFGLATLCGFLAIGSICYFGEMVSYQRIFLSHLVYKWNFPGAHFRSTMDPTVFQKSVNLIQAYAPNPRIYMISRYDSLLPFLAGKYNGMPWLLLDTALVTQREIEQAANTILTARPPYLFVDADLMDSHAGDIIENGDPLKKKVDKASLGAGRVAVLDEMKHVFARVSPHYHLIKKDFLIAVYARNT